MRKGGGFIGTLMRILTTLVIVGLLLAVFTQFNGDFGEMVRWLLNAAWSIVAGVRDAVLGWDTFQNVF